ncbi:dehydrase and lipid transport-domain-containing protein [Thelonectria olida]|uniref:Dehydrase and lipid transport-domain-containing protein n=1 Tax=Thelonectria olida TaxID=1576542 RepID=A0A9P8W6R3_9HYPO|nr:dehydrase and lipid transport-domain-containing protein [Thelonectria olida]
MALRIPPTPSCAALARPSRTITRTLTSRRPFFSLPGSSPPSTQSLTATRTLPYPRTALYDLIADVDSYVQFVPYCSRSRVTRWSDPDSSGRRWPTLADLHVGWGGFDEVFTSHLRCEPGVSVEAVSGSTQPGGAGPDASAVFRSLVTRWTVKDLAGPPSPSTRVHLAIDFQFTNPLYAAVSAAVSDKVAGLMIEAFEKQAREKLGLQRRL